MKTSLNLKKDPFVLLLFATLVRLFGLALTPIVNVDLREKVMFNVPLDSMVWFVPFFLLSFWLVYLAASEILYSRAFTWVHVLTTVVPVVLILALLFIGLMPLPGFRGEYEIIGQAMQVLALLFLFGQIFFLANVGLGLLGRFKNTRVK